MHRRTPPPPEVLQAIAEYRAELIAHRGGEENITATVRSKIEIAVGVRFRRLGVQSYLETLYPIDKRHRRVWPAMTDLPRLEAHELAILRDLGDAPVAKDVVDIARALAALHESGDRGTPGHPEEAARPAGTGIGAEKQEP